LINDFKVRKVLRLAKDTRESTPCLNSTNIGTGADKSQKFDRVFADDMRDKLEKWWMQLPQAWQFQRDFKVEIGDGPAAPEMEERISMLRADYIGHQLVIDYPLIDIIKDAQAREVRAMDEERVTRFINNNLRFIALLSPMVSYHNPNLWAMAYAYILFPLCLI
jgi:hypothetical protein